MTGTASGAVLSILVLLPAAGALLALGVRRWAGAIVLATGAGTMVTVAALVLRLAAGGGTWRHAVGGWGAPLGIELALDGLSAALLSLTAIVVPLVGLYASAYFARSDEPPPGARPVSERTRAFHALGLLLWAALNAQFIAADAFNLYVTLEAISLAGVALTALAGDREALAAALRYLLAGMLASLVYMLGIGLLYIEHGTLDLLRLGRVVGDGRLGVIALPLVLVGLGLKCALFPLHFWLPRAHASAPAPVSALLSALVVKAALYLVLRWWLDVLAPGFQARGAGHLLGALGAAAVIWGSSQALRAPRLKLVVAYSTVAQVGYPFLLFPLALDPRTAPIAWYGALYMALAHGFAKSAMFLAAGNVIRAAGHDRIDALAGIGERAPLSAFALGLSAISLIGLPISGGFVGKWLLVEAAVAGGQWVYVAVIAAGTLLALGYALRIVRAVFSRAAGERGPRLPASMEWPAIGLALGAVALGFVFGDLAPVLAVGAPGPGDAAGAAR